MDTLNKEIKELQKQVASLHGLVAMTWNNTERMQEGLRNAGLFTPDTLPVAHGNAKQSFLTCLDRLRERPAEPALVLAALEAIGLLL